MSTCIVLVHQCVQKLLPLQHGCVVQQVGDRRGDAGRGVAKDTRTGGAEHGGEGGAVGGVEQGAVMIGRLPAQPGCSACKQCT